MNTPKSTTKPSSVPGAPAVARHQARRHQDSYWDWPKVLAFLDTQEFLMLPADIRSIIVQFLVDETTWEP